MNRLLPFLLSLAALALSAASVRSDLAGGSWVRVDTDHFTLLSNTGNFAAARLGARLEVLRDCLDRTVPGLDTGPSGPVLVYLFDRTEQYRAYVPTPANSALETKGYYIPGWDGYYLLIDASDAKLVEEVASWQLVQLYLNGREFQYPPWLSDGIAAVYSGVRPRENQAVVGSLDQKCVSWLRTHELIPMSAFLALPRDSLLRTGEAERNSFYCQAWALCHLLLIEQSARQEEWNLLMDKLAQGESSTEAIRQAYGLAADELGGQLKHLLATAAFVQVTWTFAAGLAQGTRLQSHPLSDAQALSRLGDLLAHKTPLRDEEAREEYLQALQADSTNARARAGLGLLDLLRKKPGDAETDLRRALDQDSANARTWRLYGMALQDLIRDEQRVGIGDSSLQVPSRLFDLRRVLRKIMALDPADESALTELGETYVYTPDQSFEGMSLLTQAFRKNPGDTRVTTPLIYLTTRIGNYRGARDLLEKFLRPRARPAVTARAESWVLYAEIKQAGKFLREGRVSEARSLVEQGERQTKDPQVRRKARIWLEDIASADIKDSRGEAADSTAGQKRMPRAATPHEPGESWRDLVDRYNRAVRIAREGKDLETALELLVQVKSSPRSGPDLSDAAIKAETEVRAHLRYREAQGLLQAGKVQEAIAGLNEILSWDLKPDFRSEVSSELMMARVALRQREVVR